MSGGIYEYDGQLLHGDGRKVESAPEPDKPELDEKTLECWYRYMPDSYASQGVIRQLIDALRATRQEKEAYRIGYRVEQAAVAALRERIAELEQQLAAANRELTGPR